MKIGVVMLFDTENLEEKFKKTVAMGFRDIQLIAWNHALLTEQSARHVTEMCEKYAVTISTFWCGWTGGGHWNFTEGPLTLGIVPAATREARVAEMKHGSDFAALIGVGQMATHLGFIPENPNDPDYLPTVEAVKDIADHCKRNGQYFLFETGQETPTALLRLIEDSGRDNLGLNLDPANLILYGKANPVDALSVFGRYVRDVHAKDGHYPTTGRALGEEARLGDGEVNFPALIAKLSSLGYDGNLTIEREISGEKQAEDIRTAKKILEELI